MGRNLLPLLRAKVQLPLVILSIILHCRQCSGETKKYTTFDKAIVGVIMAG